MEQGRRIYITVPPALYAQFKEHGETDSFSFNPSIPLPVELPPGETDFTAETLSVEMILSGILRELSGTSGPSPYQERFDYYRALVKAVRPGILVELSEAAILKAKNGDHDTALEIFDVLSGLFPRHPAILLNRALVLEARAEAAAASGTETGTGTTSALAGVVSAELAWEDALAAPLNDTIFYAGLFYFKQGEYDRAAELLTLYIGEEEPPLAAGSQREVSGETDAEDNAAVDGEKQKKARELLEEIRENGLDDDAFREACALMRKDDEEKAILKIREFLERNPRAGKGWFILGWGLRRLSRWKDGAACFEKAVECGLDNADTRNELAICLMETGDYAGARKELEKALKDDPDNVKIISNLGTLAVKQGRNAEAEAFFRAALELDPNDPVAKAWR
ncbi:MAG: tetratricopeptide repeat protein [Treponema sp.]|jgi:tetratricopeptide (TPR) repeat protein|nr:tetratricopeptide repeat protein [Treponema sp.]